MEMRPLLIPSIIFVMCRFTFAQISVGGYMFFQALVVQGLKSAIIGKCSKNVIKNQEYGCFKSFPFLQNCVISVRQITWFQWTSTQNIFFQILSFDWIIRVFWFIQYFNIQWSQKQWILQYFNLQYILYSIKCVCLI